MFRKKVYGEYREEKCPFCAKNATAKNRQGVPVCRDHKERLLENLRCICGEPLDICQGKYGVFFQCLNCGPQSPSKVFSINEVSDNPIPYKVNRKRTSVSSSLQKRSSPKKADESKMIDPNDPNYFDYFN